MRKNPFLVPVIALTLTVGTIPLPAGHSPAEITVSAASSKLPAPQNIKVSTENTSAVISWDKVEGASKYRVYRYSAASKEYYEFAVVEGESVEAYMLSSGTKHYFKIAALSGDGDKLTEGKRSEKITVSTKKVRIPQVPNPAKYGFDTPSRDLYDYMKENFPGNAVAVIESKSADDLLHTAERGTVAFDNYCGALEEKGFNVVCSNTATKDTDIGYMYIQYYSVFYEDKFVCSLAYAMDMTNAGDDSLPVFCDYCMIEVMV